MTTTAEVDVNRQFHETKVAQLQALAGQAAAQAAWLQGEMAAGNLRQVGPNVYQVKTGWDAGERFAVNRDTTGLIIDVVAHHGLDLKADGEIAAYTTVPTWYGLAPQIPGGTTDIEQVLNIAGLNFEVELFPAYDLVDGKAVPVEGRFVTRRMDTMKGLGVVGGGYHVVNNRDAFRFLQMLVDEDQLLWESAISLRGGRRIAISARLPEDIVVDEGGIGDVIRPLLAAFNSHDGRGSFMLATTPWRPICKNTERFAVRDAVTTWLTKHSRNVAQRIKLARETLKLSHRYYENWGKESTELARTPMSTAEFDAFLDDFWAITEDSSKTKIKNQEARKEELHRLFGESDTTANCRGTAYAARCAMTEYFDFIAPTRATKDELTGLAARGRRALEGDMDNHKSKAHRKLLTLARAR